MTTLDSYENGLDAYIKKRQEISSSEKIWIEKSLQSFEGEWIFEVGSGLGERSDFIESLGYRVQRSDAALSFIVYLQEQGYDPWRFDVVGDPWPKDLQCIFASAVFLHFSHRENSKIIERIRSSLPEGGMLLASWKERGEDQNSEMIVAEGGMGERYFSLWTKDEIKELFSKWSQIDICKEKGGTSDWLQVTARS